MTMTPWAQQPALPPGAPEKPPVKKKKKGWTWPWEEEHYLSAAGEPGAYGWAKPLWTGSTTALGLLTPAKVLGLGGLAGQVATKPGMPGVLAGLAGQATRLPSWLTGGMGGMAGYAVGQTPMGPVPPAAMEPPVVPPPEPTTPPILPQPGEGMEGLGPTGQPQVIEVGGQTFWWNPGGGIYGTGGWDLIPSRAEPTPGLTPEQQIAQSEEQRMHQLEMLKLQYQLEQQAMGAQAGYTREQQAAAAAQRQAQMYAADPYKYWAQMGRGTPEAVAKLTGGEVAPGEEFGHTPMSTPSAQWWGNLLPSEQQQVAGGLNWMGIDPQDWYAMYQRMIPGLGQRQMGPVWAR